MKYKYLLIIFFLVTINHNIIPQNNIAIGFNATPALTYSYSPSDLPTPKSNFGYSFGLESLYFIQPDLFIETGLTYQNKRVLFAKNVLDTRNAWIDINGNGIIDNVDRIDYSLIVPTDLSFQYSGFSVPITINYRTSKNNTTSLIGSFGICLNYIYNIEALSKSNKFGENPFENISTDDFTSSLSLGLELYYPITNNIFLISGPNISTIFIQTRKA